MTKINYTQLLASSPYGNNEVISNLYKAIDNALENPSSGYFKQNESLYVYDISAITDEKILDAVANNFGLYGWDLTWDLATKKLKLAIGVELKKKAGTVYAIKKAPTFVLNPDKFDETNHPIQVIERFDANIYDGTYMYDGTIKYDGGGHWTQFKVIIPYDGEATDEEKLAVETQINHYKRLVCHLAGDDAITFVRLQTDFAHFRPDESGYGTIAHHSDLNITGDFSLCARLWWEGFTDVGDPLLVGKVSNHFGGNQDLIDHLIEGYDFDDNAANTTVLGVSGVINATASHNTTVLHDAAGKINSCFDFGASSAAQVTMPLESTPGEYFDVTKAFMNSLWIYKSTSGVTMFVVGNPLVGPIGTYLVYAAGTTLLFYMRNGSNYWHIDMLLATGWNHVVWGNNGSGLSSGMKAYLNGVDQGSPTTGGTLTTCASTADMTVGKGNIYTGYNEKIDMPYFFDTAPTQDLVDALYNSGSAIIYGSVCIPWAIRAPQNNDPANPELAFVVNDSTGEESITGPDLEANKENVIVVRKNGLDVDIYNNGTELSGSLTGNGCGNTDPIQLMQSVLDSTSRTYGYLSDIAIYNFALTDTQRDAYAAGYGPENVPSGYVGYWRMNEETGSTCEEYSGSGMDMTLSGAYWDDLLVSWGGNSILSNKTTSYFPMNENSDIGTVLHDYIGNCHMEGVRATADVHTTNGIFETGIMNIPGAGDEYFFKNAPFLQDINTPFGFGIWIEFKKIITDQTIFEWYDDTNTKGIVAYLLTGGVFRVDFLGGPGNEWRCYTTTALAAGTRYLLGFSNDGTGLLTGMHTYINDTEDSNRSSLGTVSDIDSGETGKMFSDSPYGTTYAEVTAASAAFFVDNNTLDEDDFEYIYNRSLGLKWYEEE